MKYVILKRKPVGVLDATKNQALTLKLFFSSAESNEARCIEETLKQYLEDLGYTLRQESMTSNVHSLKNKDYRKRHQEKKKILEKKLRKEMNPHGVCPRRGNHKIYDKKAKESIKEREKGG